MAGIEAALGYLSKRYSVSTPREEEGLVLQSLIMPMAIGHLVEVLVGGLGGLGRDSSRLGRDSSRLRRNPSGLGRNSGWLGRKRRVARRLRRDSSGLGRKRRVARWLGRNSSWLRRKAGGLGRDSGGLRGNASGLGRESSGLGRLGGIDRNANSTHSAGNCDESSEECVEVHLAVCR